MTSGSSSRRPESRLLDSAVRDAVGHVGFASSGGNPPRRTESGVKRLRSVVVGTSGNPDLPSEDNGQYNHLKPRLDMGQQGSKISPGVAVALKAAAAAAEDVNNNSVKNRIRTMGTVWDRLGQKTNESLGGAENGAGNGVEEPGRRDVDDAEEVDDTLDGTQEPKRPRWRRVSERLGPREEDDMAMAPNVNFGGFGYAQQGNRAMERNWYDQMMEMPLEEELGNGIDHFGDAANYSNRGFFRYDNMNGPRDGVSGQFQEPPGGLLYRLGDRTAQGLPHGFMSGLSGSVNLPNKLPNIHINSNARYLLSRNADMPLNGPHDLYSHLSNHDADLGRSSEPTPAGVDVNDVLEMKKRMRQVQLEMTKLRAKQAEVAKDAQKAGSAAASVGTKPRSQEEIDLHSVCVINIHFAATKEMIAAHFGSCGDILRVTILMDSAGKPRGSAYVEFSLKDSVERALTMSDSSLLSRTLKVVRKDASTESIVPPVVGRPAYVPYPAVRPPGLFMRGNPLSVRRPISKPRSFAGTANLQWKRETSSPVGNPMTPTFGQTNGAAGRNSALRSPSSMMGGDRYGLGPMRTSRSMSYVRPAPYPSREATQAPAQTS